MCWCYFHDYIYNIKHVIRASLHKALTDLIIIYVHCIHSDDQVKSILWLFFSFRTFADRILIHDKRQYSGRLKWLKLLKYLDGWVQKWRSAWTLAEGLRLCCIKPSIYITNQNIYYAALAHLLWKSKNLIIFSIKYYSYSLISSLPFFSSIRK